MSVKWPRVCLFCKHFDLDLGEPGYSSYTPGGPGVVDCHKGHFFVGHSEFRDSGIELAALLGRGVDCPDFEDSHPDNPEHYKS